MLGLDECIECGCCDVACPSHIPLTEIFRQAKNAHSLHEELSKFSAQSEQRYLRREERRRTAAESGNRVPGKED